ncbi:MAG: amidohydrolase [Spirochaetaceae bacterium]|jgi:amidohydrolase|nr:amidohydrolase [Spirochaetaceae bacterium]
MLSQEIKRCVEKFYSRGVEIRRRIHQNPELSEQERETAQLAADTLREFGIATRTSIAGNGVLGLIRGGKPGKTVLLRADMDALALNEEADVPYKSKKPGIMHACGHDGHTAGLLLAAMALSELRDKLPGTVKLMFQPAEETVGGAEGMIEAGILEDPHVDAAFGCHLWGQGEEGTVQVKSGPLMAAPDEFRVTLKGRGGHAGLPHSAVDPVVLAAHAILEFQDIMSRRKDPFVPAVLSVCMVRGGHTHNVIPESVELQGTIRTFDEETRSFIPREMEKILRGLTLAAGASYSFESLRRYPPLINDPAATEIVRKAAEKIVGPDKVGAARETMGGEDFAYVAQKIPSSFFMVGIAPPGKQVIHHSPHFQWDERALKVSAACLCQTAFDFLLES